MLDAYASILYDYRAHRDTELAAIMHRDPHVARAEHHLRALFRDLIAQAASAGTVRGDVAADELAGFCVHALTAASSVSSKAALRRLIDVTLAALQPNL